MSEINPQLSGPLVLDDSKGSPASVYQASDKSDAVAKVYLTDPSTRKRDDAHVVFGEVMVASFNAIDRAARELNVDARELAKMDLAELIRYAADYANLGVTNAGVGKFAQIQSARQFVGRVFPSMLHGYTVAAMDTSIATDDNVKAGIARLAAMFALGMIPRPTGAPEAWMRAEWGTMGYGEPSKAQVVKAVMEAERISHSVELPGPAERNPVEFVVRQILWS